MIDSWNVSLSKGDDELIQHDELEPVLDFYSHGLQDLFGGATNSCRDNLWRFGGIALLQLHKGLYCRRWLLP